MTTPKLAKAGNFERPQFLPLHLSTSQLRLIFNLARGFNLRSSSLRAPFNCAAVAHGIADVTVTSQIPTFHQAGRCFAVNENKSSAQDLTLSFSLKFYLIMIKQYTPSKTQEAAQFQTHDAADDAVPSYGNPNADDLYIERIQNYGTGLPGQEAEFANDIDSNDELQLDPAPQDKDPVPPVFPSAPPSGPLSLTLDKALIFPNTVSATALYSLNYTLNTMGNSITLSRSVPGAIRTADKSSKIIDKDLYDITRPPLSILEFHIHGKRKGTFPGTGNLQIKMGLTGKYWECKFKEKVVWKGKHGSWTDAQGKVVAKEVNEVVAKNVSKKGKEVDNGVRENPGLVFEKREQEDTLLVDLMAAVWCAKTGCAETFEARMSKPTMAETARRIALSKQ